jgi:membrane complex biogenesis BtpA family protein
MSPLFPSVRSLIGVVHVAALPGTPRAADPIGRVIERAVADARAYHAAGFDALIIENMHDRPYLKGGVGPEIVAAMTAVGLAVRDAAPLPLGVQILAGANREALAVALACGAAFVRVEGFVFAHVADEGVIESCAADLLRYRRAIGAEHVGVLADVKKKHSAHAITADVPLVDTAHAAEFFLADGVVVTGAETGRETAPEEVDAVARAVAIPVLVGSGVTAANAGAYPRAAGLIVGSWVKRGGHWAGDVEVDRCRALVDAFRMA